LRRLAILLIVIVAMLLVGCGQSTTAVPTASQSPAGPFDYAGVWAAVDDDGVKVLLLVVEDNPGDYTLSLGATSPDGQSASDSYEHGVVGDGELRWPDGFVLTEGANGDVAALSVDKPGAKVNSVVVHRQKAGAASPSASAAVLQQPSNRDQLRNYVRQLKPYQRRANRWVKDAAKAIKRVEDIGRWSSSLEQECWRLSGKAEDLAVEEALLEPPASLRKAHAQLVSSWRDLILAFSLLAKKVSRPEAPDATNADRVNRLIQRAQEKAGNWRFAVKVQSRKQDVEVPWKW
jgi:hypothetical protein